MFYWREEARELHDMAERREREADVPSKSEKGTSANEVIVGCRAMTRMALCVLLSVLLPGIVPAKAEMYVAGQVGASFPFDLRNVEGTGTIQGVKFNDLDLANTITYGAKAGYFFDDPGWRWVGVELDVFTSNPHVKQQQVTAPGGEFLGSTLGNGAHVRVLTTAINVIARYPRGHLQPYAGVGFAFVNAKVSDESLSISDSAPGLNLLAGVKGFITDRVAAYVEAKYTLTSFQFEDAGVVGAGIKGVYAAPAVVAGIAWHFE